MGNVGDNIQDMSMGRTTTQLAVTVLLNWRRSTMELFYILTFKRNSPENKPMCWTESEFHNCIFYQHQIGQVNYGLLEHTDRIASLWFLILILPLGKLFRICKSVCSNWKADIKNCTDLWIVLSLVNSEHDAEIAGDAVIWRISKENWRKFEKDHLTFWSVLSNDLFFQIVFSLKKGFIISLVINDSNRTESQWKLHKWKNQIIYMHPHSVYFWKHH